ncbi:GNAT family N-acetyltransferase [Photobacterium sp. MCCC 1A19761]|uniref:GNAT family N-acetyltransferase n=1 Tax=Photobacterium sp. MCCC 1A19761 TaxID=3115000 RepID=UPI00307FAC0F
MQYKIRKASIDDVTAIAAIHVASWSEAYDSLMPKHYIDRFTLAHREKQWANIIGHELAWVFVAEDQSDLLGFLCCGQPKGYYNPKTYELSALYIAPTRYHSDIGSCLYDTCEKHLLNLGLSKSSYGRWRGTIAPIAFINGTVSCQPARSVRK